MKAETQAVVPSVKKVISIFRKFSSSLRVLLTFRVSAFVWFSEDLEVSRPTTPCGTVIPHPPDFKVKLKDLTEIQKETTVRFAILIKGYPHPDLTL